jgi:hypothetical protein
MKARQIEAAAKAMWARDWFYVDPDDQAREWDAEAKSVKQSYLDAARRALVAAAAVREREATR